MSNKSTVLLQHHLKDLRFLMEYDKVASRCTAESEGHMGLAGATVAQGDDVLPPVKCSGSWRELGFIPLSKTGAELLFEVFSQRYERGSILADAGWFAALEAEAILVHLQYMDMVGDAVKEGPCEPFRAKELGPLVEGQVGGANTPGLSSHIPRDFDTHTAAFSDTVSLQPVGTISLRQAGA